MARYVKCFRDFSGGLSDAGGDNMADNQLQQAQNAVPGFGCGLMRAEGTVPALPPLPEHTFHRATDIIELTLADGGKRLVVFSEYPSAQQDVYLYDGEHESWTTLLSGQAPKKDCFVRAHKLYWLTGSDIKVYDGAGVSSLAATPAGSSLTPAETAVWNKVKKAVAVEQRGRRWFYATPDNEVIFSEIGDPALIDSTNIINVEPGSNDRITALKEFSGGLLIFLSNSVYFLSGWDLDGGSDVTLSRLSVSSGTDFPRTVQVAENAVYYLGRDGVYRLRLPQNSMLPAAANISEDRISRTLLSGSAVYDAFATVWNNVYHISAYFTDRPPREYRYYPRLDAFFGPYDHGAYSYSLLEGNRLYLGLNEGRIARFDRGARSYLQSDGTFAPIRFDVVTKGFDVAGALARNVKIKSLILAARQYKEESSHLTVQVKTDYSDARFGLDLLSLDESLVYGEGVFGEAIWGWKDLTTRELLLNRRAKRATLRFCDEHADEPLVIYGVALYYKGRKVKGERYGSSRLEPVYDD